MLADVRGTETGEMKETIYIRSEYKVNHIFDFLERNKYFTSIF